jgi:hypothetical protein
MTCNKIGSDWRTTWGAPLHGHGVGPSIAIFDTIRDGLLDCVCVYPAPLHSREQMQELVDTMKAVLVDGGN